MRHKHRLATLKRAGQEEEEIADMSLADDVAGKLSHYEGSDSHCHLQRVVTTRLRPVQRDRRHRFLLVQGGAFPLREELDRPGEANQI